MLLTCAEPASGLRLSCPSEWTLRCPACGQPSPMAEHTGCLLARPHAGVCSPPGTCRCAPWSVEPQVHVEESDISGAVVHVQDCLCGCAAQALGGDNGQRLVYSSGSWVPEHMWRANGMFVPASRLSLTSVLFLQSAREAQTG